jgi:hypothetical protein
MSVIAGAEGEVDQYVSEYFSVAKFRAAYAMNIPTLLGERPMDESQSRL